VDSTRNAQHDLSAFPQQFRAGFPRRLISSHRIGFRRIEVGENEHKWQDTLGVRKQVTEEGSWITQTIKNGCRRFRFDSRFYLGLELQVG